MDIYKEGDISGDLTPNRDCLGREFSILDDLVKASFYVDIERLDKAVKDAWNGIGNINVQRGNVNPFDSEMGEFAETELKNLDKQYEDLEKIISKLGYTKKVVLKEIDSLMLVVRSNIDEGLLSVKNCTDGGCNIKVGDYANWFDKNKSNMLYVVDLKKCPEFSANATETKIAGLKGKNNKLVGVVDELIDLYLVRANREISSVNELSPSEEFDTRKILFRALISLTYGKKPKKGDVCSELSIDIKTYNKYMDTERNSHKTKFPS